ncbi:endo-1,4-beta-xylanase [Catenovulum sp. 2E275]|uniref:endo-1,4-beta-xylanase n=1 Tax=Catenovulum sp. 2E275 TaxID=2980497 RepID=UPI0021D1907F|nr:endo-1,4-beta-xylanase [Catenovulum sp. 2E275]MCU4674066.1 endo-1,4-beta-xylanase [Catenovulum sp. 2E275]
MINLRIISLLLFTCIGLIACGSDGGHQVDKSKLPDKQEDNNQQEKLTEFTPVTVASLKEGVDFPIGVAVPAGNYGSSILLSEERQNLAIQHFNQLSAENIMKMDALHPTQDTFNFTDADNLVNFASNNGLSMHGHVLVWHSQTASWMRSFTGDKQAWIEMMENHVTTVATHFAGRLKSWDVVNEAFLDDGNYRNTGDSGSIWYQNIGAEFIERAFIAARAADPDAELYYNDYNLSSSAAKLGAVVNMVKDFQNRNIPIDGVGFQMHISGNYPGISAIKAQFQKVVDLGIKVKITELDIRMNTAENLDELTPDIAEKQKKRYYDVISAYLTTVPSAQRGGITVWGISDVDSWIIGLYDSPDWPLLFNAEFEGKPALQGVADALAEFK